MSDLNDLNKPDATSNYSSEVLQTIKGHIARLWSMDYTGMANLVAGMKRLVDLGSGNIQFKKRNSDGSETTIFDSSGLATTTSVTAAVAAEASARSSADTNEVSNRNTAISSAISTEVTNRNSAISSEASARSSADSSLSSAISSEAGTRAAADSSLSSSIGSLSSWLSSVASALGGKADAGQCYYSSGVYESGAMDFYGSSVTADGWGNLVMIGIRFENGMDYWGGIYHNCYARWINLSK